MKLKPGRFGVFWRAASEGVTAALLLLFLATAFGTAANAQGDADNPVAIFNQAQDLHEKGDLAGAIKLYDKALKAESNFPEAEYQRAAASLSLGQIDLAEKGFRKALELRPDWVPALTSLGSLLLDKGSSREAEKMLSRAAELEPNNAAALTALTELRIAAAPDASALEGLLAKILPLTNRANAGASLWTARAALENALKRPAAAKTSLGRALTIDPKSRSALSLRGEIAVAEGDMATASQTAALLEMLPGAADPARILRARAFAAEGRIAEAVAALDAVSKPNAAVADLRGKLNTVRATSAADLEKQLERGPKDVAVLGRLCVLYRRDNPDKALNYCRQASELEPMNVAHAAGFAAALVQARRFDTAIGVLRKILEIAPENYTARANLATALFMTKQYGPAADEFRWMVARQPDSAGPYYFLAVIQDETGSYAEAILSYKEYLRLADPEKNRTDIERVNLRLPQVEKLAKNSKKSK